MEARAKRSGVDWNRTSGLRLRSPSLYPLSYNPVHLTAFIIPAAACVVKCFKTYRLASQGPS